MSRIRVNIDRLVLNGLEGRSAKAVSEGLQQHLKQVLSDSITHSAWARFHRTPVLKLDRLMLEPGVAGGKKLGAQVAHAVGRELKR